MLNDYFNEVRSDILIHTARRGVFNFMDIVSQSILVLFSDTYALRSFIMVGRRNGEGFSCK